MCCGSPSGENEKLYKLTANWGPPGGQARALVQEGMNRWEQQEQELRRGDPHRDATGASDLARAKRRSKTGSARERAKGVAQLLAKTRCGCTGVGG